MKQGIYHIIRMLSRDGGIKSNLGKLEEGFGVGGGAICRCGKLWFLDDCCSSELVTSLGVNSSTVVSSHFFNVERGEWTR